MNTHVRSYSHWALRSCLAGWLAGWLWGLPAVALELLGGTVDGAVATQVRLSGTQ
jgi:hypothetical protein